MTSRPSSPGDAPAPMRTATADEIDACAREPIHIPSAIQPHGLMAVVEMPGNRIVQISANVEALTGRAPDAWLEGPLDDLLAEADAPRVRTWLGIEPLDAPLAFGLPVGIAGSEQVWSLTAHRTPAGVVLEFEPAVLTEAGAHVDVHPMLEAAIDRLQHARDVESLCRQAAHEVRRLTGLDRVKVYRFDPEWNGEVIAEARADHMESYLGLHFPASDIPPQARALYARQRIRLIADADYVPAPLLPAESPLTGAPLDMSASALRSVSPIHLEYLQNMGVGASMSISLVLDGELWGLVACHHATPFHVSVQIRGACVLLGQVLSLLLADRQEVAARSTLAHQKDVQAQLLETLLRGDDLAADLVTQSPSALDLIDGSGFAVYHDGEIASTGIVPPASILHDLAAWVAPRIDGDLFVTDRLGRLFEPMATHEAQASGLLAVSLSRLERYFLFWFRPERPRTVRWAGEPTKAARIETDGSRTLHPRASFAVWKTEQGGIATAWHADEVAAARLLRSNLIDVVMAKAERLRRLNASLEEANEALQRRTNEVRDLAAALTRAEQDERRRIAQVLHDDLQQMLAATRMHLTMLRRRLDVDDRTAERFTDLDDMLQTAIGTTRNLAVDLSPPALQQPDLCEALAWLAEQMEAMHGLRVRLDGPKHLDVHNEHVRGLLFQIIRELLFNTAKHASVPQARVRLRMRDESVVVEVSDDGAGFDVAASTASGRSDGFGLASIQRRLALVGGRMNIESAPGIGTRTTLEAPVD